MVASLAAREERGFQALDPPALVCANLRDPATRGASRGKTGKEIREFEEDRVRRYQRGAVPLQRLGKLSGAGMMDVRRAKECNQEGRVDEDLSGHRLDA